MARPMRDEYDFSKGEQGKFFREGAELVPPVHLDAENLRYLTARARDKRVSLSELVTGLLHEDIELIKAAK